MSHELRGEARELERSDQPRAALDVYLRLAREGDANKAGPIWTRVGDLQLRLGDAGSAYESFARAADLFSAAGQKNNAIAAGLRRNAARPGDATASLSLAELALKQGYRDYARSGMASYVRSVTEENRSDEAINAVTTFLER